MTSHASSTLTLNGNIILTGDLNTNGSVTGQGNIDVAGPWQHSGTGNITAKGNVTAGTFTQMAADSTLVFGGSTPQTLQIGPASQIQNLENNGNLKLNSDITIIGKFENTGTFDAQTKTVKLDPPANGTVTITGTGTAINTKFHNLRLSGAGGKKLVIDKKISVLGNLTLTGISTGVLTVNGGSSTGSESPEIVLTGNQTGGQYLKVKTNIPITGGTYTAENSIPVGYDTDIQAGKPENWIFTNYNGAVSWTGKNSNVWADHRNWNPYVIPGKNTDVTIPQKEGPAHHYPILTGNAEANRITIAAPATLDLAGFVISDNSGRSPLAVHGTLKLKGTADQKNWFAAASPTDKITLQSTSTVVYYDNSTANIWGGTYYKLQVQNRDKLVTGGAPLTVEGIFKVTHTTPPTIFEIDTGTASQTYKSDIDGSTNNLKFTTNLLTTMNSTSRNIKAADITVTGNWDNNARITAKTIEVQGLSGLQSDRGDIFVAGNFTVSKFIQNRGNLTFNGTGTQTLSTQSSDSKIKSLVINANASVKLGSDITIQNNFTNRGTFDATNTGSPPGYTVTLTNDGNHDITGSNTAAATKFYNLICINAGGKQIKFKNNISVYGKLTLRGSAPNNVLNLSGTNPIENPPGTPNPNHSGTIYINANKNPSEPNNCKWLGIATNLPIASLDSNTYTCTASESAPTGNFEDILPLLMAGHPKNWIFTNLDKLAWTGETNTDWNNTGNWRPRPSAAPQGTEYVTIRNVATGNKLPVLGTGTYRANEVDIRGNGTLDLGGSVIFKGITGSNTTKLTSKGTLKLKGTPAQKTWFEASNPDNKIHLDMDANTTTVVYYNDLQSEENINIWKGPYNKLEMEKGKLKIGSTPDTIEAKEFTVQSNAEVNLNSDMKINSKFKNLGKFNATTSDTTGYTVTLDNTNNITITGKDESSIQDTKFHNLKLENAAGKTLTIEKKIYIAGDLILSGASGTPLTINGSNNSAEIHLTDSHGLTLGIAKGNYLTIYTGNVKIRPEGKYYVVKDSKDDSNKTVSKNGWVFLKPNLSIVNSFAKPNDKHIYLLFDNDSLSTEEFHSLKALSHTLQITDGVTTYTSDLQTVHKEPSSYIPFGHSLWKIQLDGTQKFNPDDIINSSYQVVLNYFGTSKTKPHISDIGINIVKPQKAFNSIVLRRFDADHDDKALPTLDITIPTERTVTSDNFKLYFFSVNTLSSDNKFWYPIAMIQPPNPPTPGNLSAFAAVLTETATEYTGTPAGGLLNFIIPSTDPFLKEGKTGQFMYVYNGWLPCVRLKDKTENDILSFDVWNFKIVGVQIQKGGVSIFENVVNPHKGQSATIAAHLKKSGMLTIQIMTLDGNIVRTLTRSHHNAGDHFYLWDGRNNGGNPVASGMYFVRIAGPDIDEVRKILIIK
ncbi:hypothetical protein HGJ18_12010 [Treponema denticola]|nr:hypothetical protein HGJ18_12010 [Treponema denticola]